MKTTSPVQVSIWLLSIMAFLSAPLVQANPAGEQVVAGNASFQRTGSTLQITTSDKSIINWQEFSIQNGELTRFIQPGADSASLNRVVSGAPSSILGSLQSNGKLYLINPNGIVIGQGAQINASSFTASTLDVANEDFLAGKDLTFSGTSTEGIVNQGTINAIGGNVFLIGNYINNQGLISAKNGTIGLAAGKEVLLKQDADEHIFIKPASVQSQIKYGEGVLNAGTVEAANAEIKASGGNIYALAINNKGIIQANGTKTVNGRVLLTADGGNINNSGTISANEANGDGGLVKLSGGYNSSTPSVVENNGTISAKGNGADNKGGTVQVLGQHVALGKDSNVDVSGATGGGTALIGGDFQGKNPEIQNSEQTVVAKGAKINADATENGDGGKVIVWSDHFTDYQGDISAKGGIFGGNGGNVETSGKAFLNFDGTISTFALHGANGNILLDPYDLTIVSDADFDPTDDDPFRDDVITSTSPNIITTAPTQDTRISIHPDAITALVGNVTLQAYNDLLIKSKLDFKQTAGSTINFTAGNDIVIYNTSITTQGAALSFNTSSGGINSPTGFFISAGTIGSATTGNITINAGGKQLVTGGGWTDDSTTYFRNGDPTINGTWGVLLFADIISSGTVTINSSGDVTSYQNLANINSTGTFSVRAAGFDISLLGANNQITGNIGLSGRNVSLNNTKASNFTTTAVTGDLILNSTAGAIGDSGTVTVDGTAYLNAGANNITLDVAASKYGTIRYTGKQVTLKMDADINVGQSANTDALSITSNKGNITSSGTVNANTQNDAPVVPPATPTTFTTTLSAVNGDITFGDASSTFGSLTLKGNNVTVTEGTATSLGGSSSITGNLNLSSAGDITDTATSSTVNGIATFQTPGAIVLDQIVLKGDVYVNNASAINFGSRTLPGNLNINLPAAFTQASNLASAKSINITTGNNFTENANLTAGTGINITSAGSITQNAGKTINAGTGQNLSLTANNGTITLNGNITAGMGDISLTSSGNLTLNKTYANTGKLSGNSTAGTVTVSTAQTTQRSISLTADSTVAQNAALTASQSIDMTSKNGSITLGATAITTPNLSLTQFATLTLNKILNVTGVLAAKSTAGNLIVSSALTADKIDLSSFGSIALNASTTSRELDLTFKTTLTDTAALLHHTDIIVNANESQFNLTSPLAASGHVVVNGTGEVNINNTINAGSVDVNSQGVLTVFNPITATGNLTLTANDNYVILRNNISGGLVRIFADHFINRASPTAITASDRFLIYTSSPVGNLLGGLKYNFEALALSLTDLPEQTGNGLLYTENSYENLAYLDMIDFENPNEPVTGEGTVHKMSVSEILTSLKYSTPKNANWIKPPSLAFASSVEPNVTP